MPNYQNGKIYKIVSQSEGIMYVGSTTSSLCQRMAGHRGSYKKYRKDGKGYMSSFKVLEHADAKIVLIEAYPCNNKEELTAREEHYVENLDCVNKNIDAKAKIADKTLNKVVCACGGVYVGSVGKLRHYKTKRHECYTLECSDNLCRKELIKSGCSNDMINYLFPPKTYHWRPRPPNKQNQ